MSRSPSIFVVALLALTAGSLLPHPAHGQFQQWIQPGSTTADEPDRREELESAIEGARWQVGGLRLHPWISLHNVQYVDNIFSSNEEQEVGDITATAGAGLRGHLPLGENAFFAIHALPEYVWWEDLSERRRLNGRYGVGLFAFFNRMNVELTAARVEEQSVVTPEFEQQVNSRHDRVHALFDIDVVRSFGFHVSATFDEFENLLDETSGGLVPALERLDREEEVVRAGVKVVFADKTALRAGIEESKVEFVDGGLELDNSGSSPFFDLRFEGGRTVITFDLAYRDLEPEGPLSRFQPFEELTGSIRIGTAEDARISLSGYGSRNLIYSLSSSNSYFLDTVYGGQFGISFGERMSFTAFGELGEHDYSAYNPSDTNRIDDVASYGATLTFDLGWGTSLSFRLSRTDYDSNLDIFDREVSIAGFSFSLGEVGWP